MLFGIKPIIYRDFKGGTTGSIARNEKGSGMDAKFQWVSMAAGVLLLLYGLKKMIEGDWVPFILGLLIIGFTLSIMWKNRQKKQ